MKSSYDLLSLLQWYDQTCFHIQGTLKKFLKNLYPSSLHLVYFQQIILD